MESGLKAKSATVAAASRGLGFAAARSLARERVNITINARSAEALDAAAAEMRSEFEVDVKGVAADFNTEEGREATLDADGPPDILVNNSGVRQVPTPCDQIGIEDWRHLLEVRFLSSVDMIQRVAPGLRQQGQADAFTASPGNLAAFPFDATDPSTAARRVDGTVDQLGRLDALVNKAGILRVVNCEKGAETDLDDMWAVSAKAPFRLIRAAPPHLRNAGKDRVINIASTDANRCRSGVFFGHSVTKHALLAMNQAVRFAGWDDGVRATALCPGAIDTDLVAGIPGATPRAGRLQPETVADLVTFPMSLPNQASVPEVIANTQLESPI